jgi:hypothetical protein
MEFIRSSVCITVRRLRASTRTSHSVGRARSWTSVLVVFGLFACRRTVAARGQPISHRGKSTLLKSSRSADRQKALKAVRNPVWDLRVIYQWAKRLQRQREDYRIWLLCSLDRALREIAGVLLCHAAEPNATEVIRKFFEINWGPNDGVYLAKLAVALQ